MQNLSYEASKEVSLHNQRICEDNHGVEVVKHWYFNWVSVISVCFIFACYWWLGTKSMSVNFFLFIVFDLFCIFALLMNIQHIQLFSYTRMWNQQHVWLIQKWSFLLLTHKEAFFLNSHFYHHKIALTILKIKSNVILSKHEWCILKLVLLSCTWLQVHWFATLPKVVFLTGPGVKRKMWNCVCCNIWLFYLVRRTRRMHSVFINQLVNSFWKNSLLPLISGFFKRKSNVSSTEWGWWAEGDR